jgi:hypothetical protein
MLTVIRKPSKVARQNITVQKPITNYKYEEKHIEILKTKAMK